MLFFFWLLQPLRLGFITCTPTHGDQHNEENDCKQAELLGMVRAFTYDTCDNIEAIRAFMRPEISNLQL
jgi:hypothetical protein